MGINGEISIKKALHVSISILTQILLEKGDAYMGFSAKKYRTGGG